MIASPDDFRLVAKKRLPPFLFHYIAGGAEAEVTLERNHAALRDIRLRQRVLRDVSDVNLNVEIFGRTQNLPIVLGPVGLSGMYARRGEVQAARATAQAGVPFCLSTVSVCSLEEVAQAGSDLWFQLYMIKDRAFMRDLLEQAKLSGCSTLIFTVDMPLPGLRYRDAQSGMSGRHGASRRFLQALTRPRWAWDVGVNGRPHHLGNVAPVLKGNTGLEDFMGWMARNFDPTVSWSDLSFIRDQWSGPLVIKGIMDVEDAREARALEADGLVVSNHGGRQLDGAAATAEALPAISNAVGDDIVVLADGGVRSGSDVVKMLALGARAVLLGRSWAYALAAAGEAGVSQLLAILTSEMRTTMALTGQTSAAKISSEILHSQT